MSVIEILHGARELIADPAHWCTGAFAMDKDGAVVTPEDPKACCWNIFGAVRRAGGRHVMFQLTPPELVLSGIARDLGFSCAQAVEPHVRVLNLLTRAIMQASP